MTHSRRIIRRVGGCRCAGGWDRPYSSILSSALDALVGVFVELSEVLPQFLVLVGDWIAFFNGCELLRQVAKCARVEFVLMGLKKRKKNVSPHSGI